MPCIHTPLIAFSTRPCTAQDDTHDSIEDARTAMRIHNRYLELIEEGPQALNDAIDHVYETGHRLKWKTRGVTSPSPRGARGRT